MRSRHSPAPSLAAAMLLLLATRSAAAGEPKLTAEALVARHLEALGSSLAAAASPRVLEGACHLEIRRGGAADIGGRTRVRSEGKRLRIDLKFDSSAYWGESLSYDGDRVEIGFIQPVRRSPLGNFLSAYDTLLKEGLVGGVLSTAWPLLDVEGRGPKLKYDGIKKLDGRPVHQLRYKMAKGQGDMTVLLAFEADTFRHVGSIYSLRLKPGMGQNIEDSAGQVDVYLRMEESFDDFVALDGLQLPRRWTLKYETGGGASSTFWIWSTVFDRAAP